ncbi:signal peptidase I [Rhizomonospora bruguierae]|uniref:signal peptidase I n=1 Tax=Rhizomonospora bruguierae TaxID=1581705 RepID=UPI001BCB4DCF|nr:signal peptidase I [Micromonospora sp. NBRC 107566]
MRRLAPLLVVAVLVGAGGCGPVDSLGGTERFTQGGISMEPTVKAGQDITARAVKGEYRPTRGDIVLFRQAGAQEGEREVTYLKRVIAIGGETVACCDEAGRVTVNGKPLDEPYVADDSPLDEPPNPEHCGPRRFGPVAVAKGTVFVMGDNRANSNDSRCSGPIPAASVFAVMTT